MKNYSIIATNLEAELKKIQKKNTPVISMAETALKLIKKAISDLQKRVRLCGFTSQNDEINFFKKVQPKVLALFIFYTNVIEIEVKLMVLSPENHEKYIENKISWFQQVFQDNLEFIRYYESKSTHLDEHYFTQNRSDNSTITVDNTNIINFGCSTGYDNLVANLISYKLLQNHINKKQVETSPSSSLHWTGDKIELVELIYALNESGAISNGKTDVNELCKAFEKVFNFKLGNIYRDFVSIKRRKTDKTRFLSHLNNKLNIRIDLADKL